MKQGFLISGLLSTYEFFQFGILPIPLSPLINNTNTMSDKNQGTVKFFNAEKGFGFIKHDDSNKETFVHASGLIDQVNEGDKVEFDLQEGKKGMNAVNVKKVG